MSSAMHGARYLWITVTPLIWLTVVTFTAGWQKIFSDMPRLGFLAQAAELKAQLASGAVPAAKVAEVQALIFNNRLDAAICGLFLVLVATILVDSIRVWVGILRGTREAKLVEAPFVMSKLGADET